MELGKVFLPYGITLPSNLPPYYLYKPLVFLPYGITLPSNRLNYTMFLIKVFLPYGITLPSNCCSELAMFSFVFLPYGITPLCQVLDTYFFQISNQLFLLYFNFKIGFFKSLFIRSAYTTWSTTSDIVVILCPASLEEAPQWYILCLSVFQSMIIYLSWNSPPDF